MAVEVFEGDTMMTTVVNTLRSGLEALGLAPSGKSRQLADALIRERDAEQLQTRQTTAAQLAAAEAADLADAEASARTLAPLTARRDELRDALAAAERTVAAAVHVRRVKAAAAGLRIDRLRSDLRISASPAIAAFVGELLALLAETYTSRRTEMGWNLEGRRVAAWDNEASVQARVEAIRAAIAECGECGALVYAPLDDAAVEAALNRLRAALPAVAAPPDSVLRLVGRTSWAGR